MWSSRSLRETRTPFTMKCATKIGTRSVPARSTSAVLYASVQRRDPLGVRPVPLAGLGHEVDHAALAQEREPGTTAGTPSSSGPSSPPAFGV